MFCLETTVISSWIYENMLTRSWWHSIVSRCCFAQEELTVEIAPGSSAPSWPGASTLRLVWEAKVDVKGRVHVALELSFAGKMVRVVVEELSVGIFEVDDVQVGLDTCRRDRLGQNGASSGDWARQSTTASLKKRTNLKMQGLVTTYHGSSAGLCRG